MTNSRALAGPARSAMRWVPPAPGVRPTTRSTSPKRADSAAKMRSQPSDSSSPAVRQSAWTDEMHGKGISSSRCTSTVSGLSVPDDACSGVRSSKTWTSAPPVKTLPAARSTSARTDAASASSKAEPMSRISSSPNRLSGGESRVTMPTSPSRSKRALSPTADLRGHGRQLLRLGALRSDRQLQRVVPVARDDVHVEVEDRLPGGRLARVEQVDAVAPQPVAHSQREPLRGQQCARKILIADLVEVA